MTKELFVSATPHETKVGMVEDDLLAEIYLERENEYTLAGSIYKGRVTRVLPGMQSAFVDIGLERDAFLYVSDFMELEDPEDMDEIPTQGLAPQSHRSQEQGIQDHGTQDHRTEPVTEIQQETGRAETSEEVEDGGPSESETVSSESQGRESSESREGRGGFRNRRRRRGRRGERTMPETKYARPEQSERPVRETHRTEPADDSDYGPPPGYQPILLPGESISKYRQQPPAQSRPAERSERPSATSSSSRGETEFRPGLSDKFPEDEPLFATREAEDANVLSVGDEEERSEKAARRPEMNVGSSEWEREQQRLHQMNVAAVFGEEVAEEIQEEEHEEEERTSADYGRSENVLSLRERSTTPVAASGTMEEEEIEEEEADLDSYVHALEDDAAFEEMEEETHAAGEFDETEAHEIAAATETDVEGSAPFSAEPVLSEEVEIAGEEVGPEAEEEAELEEAQEEAEALLDAEARGNGTVDARAEVRAPSTTAAYTKRARRPDFNRRGGGQRNRRGGSGGGRRFPRREPQHLPLISDLLKEGQEILVQIAKEPIGKKGARITSHIALPGRFLVYMPTVNHTGVSRKIGSEEERQRLKRIIISERENGHGGFIVRTAAQGASEDELRADIRFLKNLWTEIRTRADNSNPPALIYHDLNVVERVLRDQVTSDFSVIWVDNEQEYERILRFAHRFQPALVRKVKLYSKETPLYDQFGLSEEINKALKSKVWLKSGGYIVINQTEALVAIDVNTGKYVGKTARLEDTIVKTNVDAIKEIVRQIRLRDLGGIIIIDFIDMDERRNRQKVMQALEEALRSDRSPSKVLQFNDFGLVAITRKRVKQSLERTIGAPCPYCQSTGFVKSVSTVCNEIYIEMRKIANHLEHADVMLRVNPEVGKFLKTNNGRLLNEMEEMTKRTVIVKSDPALHQEQFDIN
ncbi:MAG TPA: Rne/Rng family ribonuclease [Terriglobales bacterium]|nr:Rne/Rng family ribonuclease [Terriglobales bacterium]